MAGGGPGGVGRDADGHQTCQGWKNAPAAGAVRAPAGRRSCIPPYTASAAITGTARTRSFGLGRASAAGSSASTAVCLASTATVSRTAASVAPAAHRGEHARGGRGRREQILGVARVEREIRDGRAGDEHDRQQRVGALPRAAARAASPTSTSSPGIALRRKVQSIPAPSSAIGAPISARSRCRPGQPQECVEAVRCAARSTRARPRRIVTPEHMTRTEDEQFGGAAARDGNGSSWESVSAEPAGA